jgi:molybdopterin-containing oxidoreductase family iron-sulfur binding subunit
MKTHPQNPWTEISRRDAIKTLFSLAAAFTASGCSSDREALSSFFNSHFKEMSADDLASTLRRWERRYSKRFERPVSVRATPPREGVLFGYALDVSRCIGCRRCVYACVEENNQSRDPAVQWITVLQMDKGKGVNLEHADAYYDSAEVPQPDKFYFPVQCQQCENPPCVKSCPVNATWKDDDGIVVVDYDWCVGCRCCITSCPYGARHFNWKKPHLDAADLNPETEFLGNRPRPQGVVEKCTFCLQRSRKGRYPACVEVCPVGARKFGNLLDPKSEIRYVLDTHRVFILKEELNTQPKFFYYFSS